METHTESKQLIDSDMTQGVPAGWREWLGLAVLALPTFLLALDITALHLALPHLSVALGSGSVQQLWIVDIYGFMIAGFLVTMGTLGDRIGRRKLLLIGAFAFCICSVAAAYSINAEMLIIARALLGIAGATLMPSTLSLISNMFKQTRQRRLAIAVWLGCFSFGGVIGPLVGGMLLEWFWWGAVFLLGVPVMLLLLATGPFLLPEYRDAAVAGSKLDLWSVLLSVAAMLTTIYGIKELSQSDFHAANLIFIALGAGLGYLFVHRQSRLQHPLIDLQLFSRRSFNGALVGLLVATVTLGAFALFFAQYLQLVEAMSPLQAGLWMIPYATASIIGAGITPTLANRYGSSHAITGGLLIACLGYVLLFVLEPSSSSGLAIIISSSVVITIGLSPLMVLSTELAISSAPAAKAGSASSLSETCSELGMALGVAVLGTVGTIAYRNSLDLHGASSLPDELADRIRDNLPSAVGAVEGLPASLQASLLESAKESFLTGLQVVGGISAVFLLGLAVLFMTILRNVQRS